MTVLPQKKSDFAETTHTLDNSAIQKLNSVKTTFVIGLPRSGTTLLAYLLAGGDHVLSLSEPFLSRAVCRHRLLNVIFFPKIRNYRISPPKNCDEIGFLAYLKNFSSDLGFSTLIIKETYRLEPYFENITLLNRIVNSGEPVAAITRHPYDSAASTLKMFRQWRGVTGKLMRIIISGFPVFSEDRDVIEWFAENWLSFARWCKQRQPFVVRYESLVENPNLYLREICERYNIPFTQEMLNNNHPHSFFGVSGDLGVLNKRNEKLYVRPIGRRDQLKPEFIDIIKMRCSQAAEELGYSL